MWLGHETIARDALAEASATDAGVLAFKNAEAVELRQFQTGSMLMAAIKSRMPCICSDSDSAS